MTKTAKGCSFRQQQQQMTMYEIIFRWALTKWGDKFSAAEVDDIFNEFEIDDDGFLDGKAMCSLFVAGGEFEVGLILFELVYSRLLS